jgi:hypothetical protein
MVVRFFALPPPKQTLERRARADNILGLTGERLAHGATVTLTAAVGGSTRTKDE